MANNWTPDARLKPTLDDLFDHSKDVTSPAALALIKASGILQTTQPDLKVLDNGAGMGQIAEALLSSDGPKSMEIVCGDINDGLLYKFKTTKEREGWANVEVKHLDATVSRRPTPMC
jgi:ubiquinone/menaquinone biosynthesis C-methylase UbiE